MQFRVLIPDECEAGQIVRIHLQDGTEANVKIPNGLFQTGDNSFIFDLPTHQLQNPQQLYTSSDSNRSTTTTTTTTIPVGGGDNVTVVPATQIANGDNNSNLMTATASVIKLSSSSSLKYARRSFLEREINDCQDFILALSVGLLVGSAIVIGFLFGILHVTSSYPIDKDGNLIRMNHITVDDSNNNEINGILNSPSPSPEIIETIEVVNEAMQLLKQ
ncbi:hypothetical protein FRACYDRAFT_241333 [Fragilariopsis cylindrus CCMP1102]|uniref:Uncharacterized protein n=1 Tax=Fragilariopsis cylindrus CCMP1102 TaxID=635003 RepID=A0A1E7F9C9_9STRA|nr:hypothetical protein FRACYDRAFT_241333 [Fragilariopsis cylindrus CCMP1102]|eukprot:OEU14778.1 hypothetical protein FRACYDRAFT_241333 [Fragilariopsis cylindrus CCMP1102]